MSRNSRALPPMRRAFVFCSQRPGDALRKTAASGIGETALRIVVGVATLERDYRLTVSFRAKGDAVRQPVMIHSNARRVFQCALVMADDDASAAQVTSAPVELLAAAREQTQGKWSP